MPPATKGTGNREQGTEPPRSLGSRCPVPGSLLFRLPSPLDLGEHFGAALSPWIELVRRRTGAPSLLRVVLLASQPVRATEPEVRLDEIRAQRQALAKEGLRVVVHLALEVHQSQVVMCVERRLRVVVEPDGLRQVLDRLAEDSLLEADVADVDARERVRRLLHQDPLEIQQGVVVLLLMHLRPAKQRRCLEIVRRQLERLLQRRFGGRVVAERDAGPALLDEGRGPDVVGAKRRGRGLKRRRLRRTTNRLPALHEPLNVLLEGAKLGELALDGPK